MSREDAINLAYIVAFSFFIVGSCGFRRMCQTSKMKKTIVRPIVTSQIHGLTSTGSVAPISLRRQDRTGLVWWCVSVPRRGHPWP